MARRTSARARLQVAALPACRAPVTRQLDSVQTFWSWHGNGKCRPRYSDGDKRNEKQNHLVFPSVQAER